MQHPFLLPALVAVAALAGGCDKEPSVADTPPQVDFAHIVTTTEYVVPVQEGRTTVVYNRYGEEIARTPVPMTLLTAKDEELSVAYLSDVPADENIIRTNLWQVIAFEDSRTGDYDYNDLVLHVKYEVSGKQFLVGLQPIALGSTKKIRLGCDVWQNGKPVREGIIVADDCRTKFFAGSQDRMVNTYAVEKDFCVFDYKPYYASNIISLADPTKPVYVNWFIEVDGHTRLYAVSAARPAGMFDAKGRPYGLVFTSTGYNYTQAGIGEVGHDWFNYPRESVSIDTVYPLFGQWLRGEYTGTVQSMYDPSAEGAFDAIGEGLYVVPSNMTSNWNKPSERAHVIPWNKTQEEIDAFNW